LDTTTINLAHDEMEICSIDPEDFERIVLQHQKQIFRILLCLVRDRDMADTLTQESFLRAYKKRASFRGESYLTTWLVRIAINLAHDHCRNRRWAFWQRLTRTEGIETLKAVDGQRSPEQVLIDGEKLNTILSIVERLTERQKTVFLLRFVEDMSLEQIAGVTNLALGTVKSHLSRALDFVRGEFERHNRYKSLD
jgi:RNA polymerase sigma-70 factor (ECF subfamily)